MCFSNDYHKGASSIKYSTDGLREMRTKGREVVKITENFAYVLNGCPLKRPYHKRELPSLPDSIFIILDNIIGLKILNWYGEFVFFGEEYFFLFFFEADELFAC